jgi:hypothetical protein
MAFSLSWFFARVAGELIGLRGAAGAESEVLDDAASGESAALPSAECLLEDSDSARSRLRLDREFTFEVEL